ncbi:MAG: molybdate ABC transporter substrate-binding protein [Dehalococcoidia bacterium]
MLLAVLGLLLSVTISCGDAKSPEPGAPDDRIEADILVFAASSLTDAFDALAEGFRVEHPAISVTFNYASSSALATQINERAPTDVFASANDAQMKIVTVAGNASDPQTFATNVPVIVVPAGSKAVASLADLAVPGVRLVLAGPDVPIGAYSRQVLGNAADAADGPGADFADRVLANLKSNESNVRAVLTKVQLGEADAGIVYQTDVALAGDDVEVIQIPAAYNVVASYPIAVTKESRNPAAAAAWIAYVLSPEGQAVLQRFGFGPRP